MQYIIRKSCNSNKDYETNEKEKLFFSELHKSLSVEQNKKISVIRMSDGSISVCSSGFPIGKIKLQGRKYWMQVLKGLYTSKSIEGDVQDFIEHISDWKRYITKYCK